MTETRRRILVVLPLYGGSLPIGRFCARALQELGHIVEVFEAPQFHGAFSALRGLRIRPERLTALENNFLHTVGQAVLANVETFAPDMVLALAQAPLSRQVLTRLKRDGVPTIMWFVEDFQVFPYWRAFAPLYDAFAVIQKDEFFDALRAVGQERVLYLPLAADPQTHRFFELSAVERRKYGSALSFVGAGYPNRRRAFRQLADFDLRIWGSDWDGETLLAPFLQRGGTRIDTEEVVRIFNASTINLNLHSSVQQDVLVGAGDFVNPRTFELAACGAFQLVDDRSLLAELFAPDELALFADMPELLEKIRYFLNAAEERAAMTKRAQARVLAEHTYMHRMQKLMAFMEPLLGEEKALPPWRENLPEELAQEVEGLLTRLSLPADVNFTDLIWAVRAQDGVLTPLETTLLFLDEWRKQYANTE